MSKKLAPPSWWKNTYFWIAAILFVVFVIGLIKGPDAVRDPGQLDENGLIWIYLAGAVVMAVNGYLSHKQYVQNYNDEMGINPEAKTSALSDLVAKTEVSTEDTDNDVNKVTSTASSENENSNEESN